ncbi:hypothetical protein VKT23_005421 [Stygiomarasmius scandens]|uniref:CASTOR ACT domain-containing protein n=1 Tax=Marasmiellus scandens TaxID=2682957 RepID=A0ABR1JPZ6_9AGAR
MPPPSDHPCLHLHILPKPFFVAKLEPHEQVPAAVADALLKGDKFISLTRTKEELSFVGEENEALPEPFRNCTWRGIKVQGPMEFELTSVAAGFTAPLGAAGIGVFVLATWNTDYILVAADKFELAVEALKTDGWRFAE